MVTMSSMELIISKNSRGIIEITAPQPERFPRISSSLAINVTEEVMFLKVNRSERIRFSNEGNRVFSSDVITEHHSFHCMRTYILNTSSSSHTSIPLNVPSGSSLMTLPEDTRAITEKESFILIARVEKFVDANTGEVTSIMSPSLITPVVRIIHVEVCGTVNESARYDNNI
jgi:hypothetical protein